MFINIGNSFCAKMNIEACVNMAFSKNVQTDDPAEQGTSDNAAPGNPRQQEVLHVRLPHIFGQMLFQVVTYPQLSVVFGCTSCP
jgi:hypothetical protein